MYTKQISVFLENTTGSLHAMTRLLGEHGVDLIALSIADNDSFGVLRCVANSKDIPTALNALRTGGYTARLSDVVCVCVPDRPAGLADVLGMLDRAQISIEYLYSFVRNTGVDALIIFKLSDPEKGVEVFKEHGIKVLGQSQVDLL
ncbi:MAG: amino acid-binding protein [Christensenellales bacterium]|jgi:hypothetical protein